MIDILKPLREFWRALPFTKRGGPLVTVIELSGVITAGARGLSLARVDKSIEAAFKPSALAAVALRINSPGGSPVQSRLILQAIRRAAKRADKPVFAFIEDVGASGGYIVALAGDEIYADESSIVGSIGVISASFGLDRAIERLGVERRVYTAGESKSQLDPFRPQNPEDVTRLKTILDELHGQFIALVRERRGDRLKDETDIFSGAYWTAPSAMSRGLIDGTAHLGEFMQRRFGEDVTLKKIEPHRGSLLSRLVHGLMGGAPMHDAATHNNIGRGGVIDPDDVIAAVEARLLWARYGL